ncbi:MAG TPA: HAMP domain-containing sensor histidine kinase [Terriglobales bacterium]|jgi:signal transduction histidine kinase|nr:HAMP domain-containing sensor histidine kinase [Terriglobales bacterium]
MTWKKHAWAVFTAGLILTCTAAAFNFPHGHFLTAFGDVTQFLLVAFAAILMVSNAVCSQGQTRGFWLLMAAGCCLWATSLGAWTYFEVLRRREVPEPFFGDVILFIHIVPFMAAVALRPHRPPEEKKLYFSTLNFLMLLIWWLFLYAFAVFPNQYVVLNSTTYNQNYDLLYLFENLVLLVVLGLLTTNVQGPWKKVYWNFFIAAGLYTWSSESINAAITRGQYYTGSWYDIPLVTSMCWLIFAGLMARDLKPVQQTSASPSSKWLALSPRLAMLAILSLPVMGFWSQFRDPSAPLIRLFRLLVTLAAMLVLGGFVFLRQYVLDRELMRLLEESRLSLESLKRLQTQLVQKEKLASLGQLVSGAAHEINNPVAAILGYSELLASNQDLNPAQVTMAQKIGQQARRTRDLLSGLLSFAQQAPAEKMLVEVGPMLQRALQMKMLQMETKGIRVHSTIAPNLPRIWGNPNQLMQCCLEIIGNSMDAQQQTAGGTLWVNAKCEDNNVVLTFSDSGPGIREPERVFDPFYTTKPVGKGTGLGLSATYGVVQDHGGQIGCHNRPEGGAVFILRLPVAGSEMPVS